MNAAPTARRVVLLVTTLLLLLTAPVGPVAAATPPVRVPTAAAPVLSSCAQQVIRSGRLRPGVNVSITCQRAFFVTGTRVRRVAVVSTGMAGHRTRTGSFRIFRAQRGWQESRIYRGAYMYWPLYFSGGQAIHGSATDALVTGYPASHGCIRMRHADVRWLWDHQWTVGTPVHVFGTWQG